jgi:N-acetylglutamate synthase
MVFKLENKVHQEWNLSMNKVIANKKMNSQGIVISPMTINDYDAIFSLWNSSKGIILSNSDSKSSLNFYLNRNPETSFVAKDKNNQIIGTILCGHDGSKGYIRHLAVSENFQKIGIGKNLVEISLAKLKFLGITKCSIFLLTNNEKGKCFWMKADWHERKELEVMSKILS